MPSGMATRGETANERGAMRALGAGGGQTAACAVGVAFNHDDHVDSCGELGVQPGAIQPAQRGERFEAGGDLRDRVGVQGAGAAVVAGVQCCEQVDDFGAADLAHYDAVGSHAQRLTHQVRNGDLAGALGVRAAGGQVDHVRMVGGEFQGVFDGDDALGRVDLREQGG